MPSLDDILKKTKPKSEQNKIVRKPPDIAMEDRPYSVEPKLEDIKTSNTENIAEVVKLEVPPSSSQKLEDKKMQTENQTPAVVDKLAFYSKPTIKIDDFDAADIVINEKLKKKSKRNQTQTGHKQDTNGTQEPNTNGTQTGHKNSKVVDNQTQTGHKRNTQPNTNGTQIEHERNTNRTQKQRLDRLSNGENKVLNFLFTDCKLGGSLTTSKLSPKVISGYTDIKLGSIKTTIKRLRNKIGISISDSIPGISGWTRYEIPDDIYKELMLKETGHKRNTNRTQTEHKWDTQPNTQPDTNPPSSSSLNNLKETTTEWGSEWNFDITPYAKFGFTSTQLKQLASLGIISAADVERCLIEFSYDLDNNIPMKINSTKCNYLMGLMRKGQVYVSEGYKNEQEAAIAEMARRGEAKRKKLLDEKLEAWMASLDEEQQNEMESKMPLNIMTSYRAHGLSKEEVKNWIFDYFMQQTASQ